MRYLPTGRAIVYREGNPTPIRCDLEAAKQLYVGVAGYEVYSIMGEADGE